MSITCENENVAENSIDSVFVVIYTKFDVMCSE